MEFIVLSRMAEKAEEAKEVEMRKIENSAAGGENSIQRHFPF